MKPHGSIPADFATIDGELRLGATRATDVAAGGTPCFAYDFGVVRARVARLRAALPAEVALHYAIKANPFPPLVAALAALVDGLDVASGGELELALPYKRHEVSFAGPGKRDAELEAAIRAGATINLESEGEAARALRLADQLQVRPRLAVRVNPAFQLKGSGMKMGGGASPFGIDAERVPALVRQLIVSGADWRGFHIYAGSQSLDPLALIATQAATISLAAELGDASGNAPPLVNLGGGFGVPYFAGDRPLDLEQIGAALAEALDLRPSILSDTGFAVELGRWLVAECGVYLTRIVDRKESRGEVFLVTDGGLHHQLAASGNFGTVVRRNYPIAIANRMASEPSETVNVVGCLCTPLDRLGDAVQLPHAQPGDLVALFMAGAYGASASPSTFLGHPAAREVLIDQ